MQSARISTTRSCQGFGIEHPPYDSLSAWLGVADGPEGAQWHVPSSDNIVSVFFLSSAGADGGSGVDNGEIADADITGERHGAGPVGSAFVIDRVAA